MQLPCLEKELYNWTVDQRENSRCLLTVLIRVKEKHVAAETSLKDFKVDHPGATDFLKRNNLNMMSLIFLCEKLPDN